MRKILMKSGFIVLIAALALMTGCLSYTVDSVEVSIDGNATSIDAGQTIQFKPEAAASGKDTSGAQRFTWKVSSTSDGSGPVTPGTSVSPSGVLMVSPDEIYPVLYVRATHAVYTGKYDFKQIQVKGPKVGSVVLTVAGSATSVAAGGNIKLSAFVAGKSPNVDLTYSVGIRNDGTGTAVAGTAVANDGTLTVSANETASSVYVKATSNTDATKFAVQEIKIVTVTSVTVTAEGGAARVVRGNRLKFNAVVAGNNSPGQNVTWKVSSNAAGDGAVTSGTVIASDGTLTVAATEAASTLYVTATSAVNTTKFGSITVTIPTVTSVTVSPVNPTIRRGEGVTFTARVQGTGNPGQDVTWKLDGVGGVPSATTITSNGMLIVSTAETLSGLIVTATSVDDPTKSGTSMITIPATPAAIVPATPAPQVQTPATGGTGPYIITGSGTTFTATRGGATVGTAGQSIQTVIEAIRTHAAGADCTVQFGDGTAVLDIGTANAKFGGMNAWGKITLTGKITSSNGTSTEGTIVTADNTVITSRADVANTYTAGATSNSFLLQASGSLTITGGTVTTGRGNSITNNAMGSLTISGGTVQATNGGFAVLTGPYSSGTINITGGTVKAVSSGHGIRHNGTGAINISGGTVQAIDNSVAIYFGANNSSINITGGTVSAEAGSALDLGRGTANISGGTVKSTTGNAVNAGGNLVKVSGTAKITSARSTENNGTMYWGTNNGLTAVLEMTGGTVENTSSTTGNAIYNNSTSAINITGGTVQATGAGGYAINNNSTGVVTVSTRAKITGRQRLTP